MVTRGPGPLGPWKGQRILKRSAKNLTGSRGMAAGQKQQETQGKDLYQLETNKNETNHQKRRR